MFSDTGVHVDEEEFQGEQVADAISDLFTVPEINEETQPEEDVEEVSAVEDEKEEQIKEEEPSDERQSEEVSGEAQAEGHEEKQAESDETEEVGDGAVKETEEAPEEKEEPSDLDILQERNAKLMTLIEELSSGQPIVTPSTTPAVTEPVQAPTAQPPVAPVVTPVTVPQPVQPTPQIEITTEQYQQMFSMTDEGREAFGQYLGQLVNDRVQTARQQMMMEQSQIVVQALNTRREVDGFFNKVDENNNLVNADLAPIMNFVQQTATAVEAQNPHLTITEVLEKSADLVRERIGGAQQIGRTGRKLVRRTKPNAPSFAKTTSRRKSVGGKKTPDAQTVLTGEIKDLLG